MPANKSTTSKKPSARDASGRFVRGQSGNPRGRAPGTANARTREVRDLLDRLTPAVLKKLYEMLLAGDPTAVRILADRVLPRRRLLQVDLPVVASLADVARAQQSIAALVASGELDSGEAADLAVVVDRQGQAIERRDIEERLSLIEAQIGDGKK